MTTDNVLAGYHISPVITPETPVITPPKTVYVEVRKNNPWIMILCGAAGFFAGAGMVWVIAALA